MLTADVERWKSVTPVSEPIGGVFRAMKTLRGVDDTHSPRPFARIWGAKVKDIIDISHNQPVYDAQEFQEAGIGYHKFPTISKVTPTDAEVAGFISLVDEVRASQERRAAAEAWDQDWVIGVHCHYGFNRTGYFIVCYLVERCGFTLQAAIDEFATKRTPKGIRHPHFLSALALRYAHIRDLRDT